MRQQMTAHLIRNHFSGLYPCPHPFEIISENWPTGLLVTYLSSLAHDVMNEYSRGTWKSHTPPSSPLELSLNQKEQRGSVRSFLATDN